MLSPSPFETAATRTPVDAVSGHRATGGTLGERPKLPTPEHEAETDEVAELAATLAAALEASPDASEQLERIRSASSDQLRSQFEKLFSAGAESGEIDSEAAN